MAPASVNGNKLLSRDSLNLLFILSLTLGFFALLVTVFMQRNFKPGGAHFYLPRPGQQQDEKAASDNGKPKGISASRAATVHQEDDRPGYVPLTEEEVKLDSTP